MGKAFEPMNYGTHSHLVAEVFDLARSGSILKPGTNICDGVTIVDSISEASRLAWDELYGEDEMTWSDIRSQEMAKIWDKVYASDGFSAIDKRISSQLDTLGDVISGQIDEKYYDMVDEIVFDLRACIYSRAIDGQWNHFFEDIFNVYRHGAWPCGWSGEFPEGCLFAYIPRISD